MENKLYESKNPFGCRGFFFGWLLLGVDVIYCKKRDLARVTL